MDKYVSFTEMNPLFKNSFLICCTYLIDKINMMPTTPAKIQIFPAIKTTIQKAANI